MKFNLYNLNYDKTIIFTEIIDSGFENKELILKLNSIEYEIVHEFLKKQNGKIGVKTLGNELRYNSTLKSIFSCVFEGMVIIKTTENRRAFIKNFLENYVQYYNETIYFFVLENNFGCDSNLVDNSFIRVKEIVEELSVFFEYFNPIMEFPTIKIIEMKGFENYFIETINGFSKIQKYH